MSKPPTNGTDLALINAGLDRILDKQDRAAQSKPEPRPPSDAEIIIEYLKNNHNMAGWDWGADEFFAKRAANIPIKAREAAIELGRERFGVAPLAMGYHRAFIKGPVTQRRLRACRKLIAFGIVKASWTGTGRGGYTDYGIRRDRLYRLAEEFKK